MSILLFCFVQLVRSFGIFFFFAQFLVFYIRDIRCILIVFCGFRFVIFTMAPRPNLHKVDMVYCYGQANKNSHEAVRLFNLLHPERPVDRTTLRRLIQKFETTFCLKDAPRSGRPRALDEDQQLDILTDFIETPQQSIRQVAEKHDTTNFTVHTVLKSNKFHPYKTQLIHELNEDDFDRRMQFCEIIQNKIAEDPDFVRKICFSDECTFFLNGALNRHNSRYWAPENPHLGRESHTQYPQKINVWAGIFNDQIVGPFFIEDNLNGPLYLQLLQDAVVPRIVEIIEESGEDLDPIFQQDGAPPHYAVQVRTFLDQEFPDSWIGRRGPIEWAPRSPDLSSLDFFLWGHLKSNVYVTKPADIQELKQRIADECRKITPQMLRNVRAAFEMRLYHCQAAMGAQFEHLID